MALHILISCHTKAVMCIQWPIYWFLKMFWTYQPLNLMLIIEMPFTCLKSGFYIFFNFTVSQNLSWPLRSKFSSSKCIWVFITQTICLVPDTYYHASLIFTFLWFQTNNKFLRGIASSNLLYVWQRLAECGIQKVDIQYILVYRFFGAVS